MPNENISGFEDEPSASMKEILATVSRNENDDVCKIIAMALNCYLESMRLLSTRKVLTSVDIPKIFQSIRLNLNVDGLVVDRELEEGIARLAGRKVKPTDTR